MFFKQMKVYNMPSKIIFKSIHFRLTLKIISMNLRNNYFRHKKVKNNFLNNTLVNKKG